MATTRRREREAIDGGRDDVIRFGTDGELVGILSRPTRTLPTPAVVILNAGVLHRVGPHRLHVHLARELAARGFTTLRLDLGGIGDSVASSDAATFRESAVSDTRLAITGLADAAGAERAVIFGVCAGADNAIATALVDERVAGIVLVDPYLYESRRAQLRALRAKIAQRGSVGEVVRWGLSAVGRRVRAELARLRRRGNEPAAEGREPPPIDDFRCQLTTLVDRGVKILATYSGSNGVAYNADGQLFELFPEFRGRIDERYFPNANHTFTELTSQAQLIDAVASWIASRFL